MLQSISQLLSSWGAPDAALQALEGFANPATHYRPYIRWWWPHGLVEIDEVRNEVSQIAHAGFGGIEIQDAHHSIPTGTDLDTETHGWGSQPWIDAVMASLEIANSRSLVHDTAFGPAWPAGVPSIVPDDTAAAKEVALGKTFVTKQTYNGSVPAPHLEAASNVHEETILAVQAWRVSDTSSSTANPVYLDRETVIDLTNKVMDGKITFTPPDDATWLLYSATVRGTGQHPEDYPHTKPTTYVVDHFSKPGAQAVIDYWEEHILSDKLLALLAETPTAFMEDSLEMTTATYWTPDLPAEFKTRRGYDIHTILPVITQYTSDTYLFQFSDFENQAALNDYYDTLSELYIERHIKPLKSWVNSLGFQYRVQAYGIPQQDGIAAAATADIPEGESLGFEAIDDFRALAGAANMANITRLSNELGAYRKMSYATTWAMILATVNAEFAAGVNQNIIHGFSYLYAPGAIWPGWAAFSIYEGDRGYSESWGPRQPTWQHAPDFTGYLGRAQYILQRGVAKYDCAFFRQNGAVDADYIGPWFTNEGAEIGWSTAYIDGSLLELPAAYVENGRFAPTAGNYSLIALEADPEYNQPAALPLRAAKRLYELASDGLPILMIGNWSSPQSYGLQKTSSNSTVASIVKKMLALENVVNVVSKDDIPGGLEKLGVQPAVQYEPSSLMYTHREDGDMDHFFFNANSSSTGVNQTVSIPARQYDVVPVQLDPWTGNATILSLYSLSEGHLSFPLLLDPNQSAFITLVLATDDATHAVDSTADSIVRDSTGQRLLVQASTPGTYHTTLEDGSVHTTSVENVSPVIELTNWALSVDSWEPDSDSTDVAAIKLVRHNLNITSLEPWTSLEGLEDVSGNGTYKTAFTIGTASHPYSNESGAYLELERFNGSFRAAINGQALPPLDQLGTRFDVSRWLQNGSNTLEVEVASSLLNRMRVVEPSIWYSPRQAFGLLGARLVPFTQAFVN